jgi:predicted ATPase with chaperone activity
MDSFPSSALPAKPRSVEETGLSLAFLTDLTLKTIHIHNQLMGHEIADALKLPFTDVVEKVLGILRREYLIQIGGSAGSGPAYYRYLIAESGRKRARELMQENQYTGPAPVSLKAYVQMVNSQSLLGQPIPQDSLKSALSHLVLSDALINTLGPALNSGGSIFLYGHVGNGKTSIGLALPKSLKGTVWIPYSVSVDGQIIQVFDAVHHWQVPEESKLDTPQDESHHVAADEARHDQRWVLCHRPLIVGGGELRLKDFDLVFDPLMRYYQAPHHVKANGGVFLIDDFGRQASMPWYDALNRWSVPLDQRIDNLTLETGQKISVPFDVLVIFATNLDPLELVDEAYWRRIRNKIHVPDPTWEEFQEIFIREAARRKIAYSEEAFQYMVAEHYTQKIQRQPRGFHPRDILDILEDIAHFRNVSPIFSKESIDQACQVYFIKGGLESMVKEGLSVLI